MHNLSMIQALSIWSDLEAAYYGKAGYGDIAEIYMYRLMPCSPASEQAPGGEQARERIRAANESLYALLHHFAEHHDVKIYINGDWLSTDLRGMGYSHRVEVRVEHRKRGTDSAKD